MKTVIIGGGVIGLSIARELHKNGVRGIAVVDKGKVGREASWAAAGMLAPNAETDKIDDFYRFCSESNSLYPSFAKELFLETGIDIDYICNGTLELAFDSKKAEDLARKLQRQREADIPVEFLETEDLLRMEPNISSKVVSGLFYPHDGQVDNRKLVVALESYARKNEIEIIENSEASSLFIEDQTVTGIQLADRTIRSDLTILTTGAWTSHIQFAGKPAPFDVKPIRGQMLGLEGAPGLIKTVVYGAGAYLVQRSDGRVLIGATVENVGFDRCIDEGAIDKLRLSAIETVPELSGSKVIESWCGFRPFSVDGLPIIGDTVGLQNLVVATGHYRNGILLAPLTAKIVASLVTTGVRSNFLKTFGPERFGPVGAAACES